jgi:hypothetical protein
MDIIGGNFMAYDAAAEVPDERGRFRYPRTYAPSGSSYLLSIAVLVALCFFPLVGGSDLYGRFVFAGFSALIGVAFVLYALGWKLTLYADKIEYRSSFVFKRSVARSEIANWQLRMTSVRNAEVFSLLLTGSDKDLAFEINFEPDAAFYAWFPKLQALIQEREMQFPGLARLSR